MATKTKREGAPVKPTRKLRASVSFGLSGKDSARIQAQLDKLDTPPSFSGYVKALVLFALVAKEKAAATMATGRPVKRRGT